MKRAVLKDIPFEALPEGTPKIDKPSTYLYNASVLKIGREKILTVYVWNRSKVLQYRAFITPKEFILQGSNGKFSVRDMLDYLPHWMPDFIPATNAANEAIRQAGYETIYKVAAHTQSLRKKRIKKEHDRRCATLNKKMSYAVTPPPAFEKWIREKVFEKSKYIFYEHKTKYAYCTACKHVVPDQPAARHNKQSICPNCGAEITFKAVGRSKNFYDETMVGYAHMTPAGLMIQHYHTRIGFRSRHKQYLKPEFCLWTEQREIIEDGRPKTYIKTTYSPIMGNYETVWQENDDLGSWRIPCILYPGNLRALEQNDIRLKYLGITRLSKKNVKIDLPGLLQAYAKYPFVEMLLKKGFYKLAQELSLNCRGYSVIQSELNLKATKPKDLFGTSGQWMRVMQEMNVNSDELEIVRVLDQNHKQASPEEIRYLAKVLLYDECADILKYTTAKQAVKYIKRINRTESRNWGYSRPVGEWIDYLSMAEKLEYDMKNTFVLFPGKLREAHDRVTREYNKIKKRLNEKLYREYASQLREAYSFQYGNIAVMVPEKLSDIVKEGTALHHCVANYTDSVALKRTAILFVRRADQPDKSLYTMEIKNGTIIQVRGRSNKTPKENEDKEVLEALKKFKQAIGRKRVEVAC